MTQEGGTGRDGLFRPQLDLAVLSKADVMIGHCPSSFTAIAAKMRKAAGRQVSYWGLPLEAAAAAAAAVRTARQSPPELGPQG